MTYADIFARCVAENTIAPRIEDYRPSELPNSIIVWSTWNHLKTISLIHYSETADMMFVLSSRIVYV